MLPRAAVLKAWSSADDIAEAGYLTDQPSTRKLGRQKCTLVGNIGTTVPRSFFFSLPVFKERSS